MARPFAEDPFRRLRGIGKGATEAVGLACLGRCINRVPFNRLIILHYRSSNPWLFQFAPLEGRIRSVFAIKNGNLTDFYGRVLNRAWVRSPKLASSLLFAMKVSLRSKHQAPKREALLP